MKLRVSAIILLGALASTTALAQQAPDHSVHHTATAANSSDATAPSTEGEVRKVDKDAKKITIRHGAIVNLEMPPMTMVFLVSDPTMLDRVKAGDKVRFSAEKREGAYTVTKIETAS